MFLRLVLIVTLINSITGPVATAIQAKGKIKLFQTIILGITLLDIPISYIVLKSGYIPDTFTGFILICIITVSSTTIVLLTVGLKTAERSLIYKKAIRTIQTTKS